MTPAASSASGTCSVRCGQAASTKPGVDLLNQSWKTLIHWSKDIIKVLHMETVYKIINEQETKKNYKETIKSLCFS